VTSTPPSLRFQPIPNLPTPLRPVPLPSPPRLPPGEGFGDGVGDRMVAALPIGHGSAGATDQMSQVRLCHPVTFPVLANGARCHGDFQPLWYRSYKTEWEA
jgi:hypothetical protein